MFKLLMATSNFDIHLRNSGVTLLWLAARNGYDSRLKLLLDAGKADVNATVEGGDTPISVARRKKNEAIVRSLLGTGKVIEVE